MTAEPVPIGKMFQVTVLEKKNWLGGLVSITAAANHMHVGKLNAISLCTDNFTT